MWLSKNSIGDALATYIRKATNKLAWSVPQYPIRHRAVSLDVTAEDLAHQPCKRA